MFKFNMYSSYIKINKSKFSETWKFDVASLNLRALCFHLISCIIKSCVNIMQNLSTSNKLVALKEEYKSFFYSEFNFFTFYNLRKLIKWLDISCKKSKEMDSEKFKFRD